MRIDISWSTTCPSSGRTPNHSFKAPPLAQHMLPLYTVACVPKPFNNRIQVYLT